MLEADLARFPPPEIVKPAIAFGNAQLNYLKSKGRMVDGAYLRDWQDECDRFTKTREYLAEAQDKSKNLKWRIDNMLMVAKILKWSDFLQGQLPPLPLHRFKEGRPSNKDLASMREAS
jgi:hypothetical protein